MKAMMLVARRELGSYLNTVWGWGILAFVLLIDGLLFNAYALGSSAKFSSDVLEGFFYFSSGTTMIAGILLTIRVIAEERQTGTLVILQKAPISEGQIVFGKFLGAFGFLTFVTLLTIYMPLLIFVNGRVAVGHILVGYVGLVLLTSAALSIGLFASTLARTQVIAVIIGAVILLVLIVPWALARVTDPPLNTFFSALALHHDRFRSFGTGVLKLENVVLYLAVSYFFLLAATKTLEARRWR